MTWYPLKGDLNSVGGYQLVDYFGSLSNLSIVLRLIFKSIKHGHGVAEDYDICWFILLQLKLLVGNLDGRSDDNGLCNLSSWSRMRQGSRELYHSVTS